MSIHFIYIFLNIHVCTYKIQCESYSQTGCTFYSPVLTSQQFSKRIKNEKIHIYNVIDRFIIFSRTKYSTCYYGVFLRCFWVFFYNSRCVFRRSCIRSFRISSRCIILCTSRSSNGVIMLSNFLVYISIFLSKSFSSFSFNIRIPLL